LGNSPLSCSLAWGDAWVLDACRYATLPHMCFKLGFREKGDAPHLISGYVRHGNTSQTWKLRLDLGSYLLAQREV